MRQEERTGGENRPCVTDVAESKVLLLGATGETICCTAYGGRGSGYVCEHVCKIQYE